MIQSVPAINTTPILCQNKNLARLACITPNCHCHGFVCCKQQCKFCEQKHLKCRTIWIDNIMTKLQNKVQVIPQQVHQGIQQLDRIYQQAIKKLEKSRKQLRETQSLYGLNIDQINLIHKLKQDNFKLIEGDTISKIYKNIELSQIIKTNGESLKKYWKKKNNEFKTFLKKISQLSKKDWRNFSDIIENGKEKIQKFFPDETITQIQLLYRASEHDFQVEAYHKLCDNHENTLVLAKTQYGKIIGGFTPVKYGSQFGFVIDPTNRTFVFSISENKMIPCLNPNLALNYNRALGPAFGSDFTISNQSNIIKQNVCTLTSNYPYPDLNDQSGMSKFTGSRAIYFGIEQWQVFQLTFDKPLEKKKVSQQITETSTFPFGNNLYTQPFVHPMPAQPFGIGRASGLFGMPGTQMQYGEDEEYIQLQQNQGQF